MPEPKYCENCGKLIEVSETYVFINEETFCAECIAASGYVNTDEEQEDF